MELSKFHFGKKQGIILAVSSAVVAAGVGAFLWFRNRKAKNGTNEEVPADPQN